MEKENNEIPFGAKDSELYKFEYTIPEGYEAEIKDGKVIMKKMESKDERIRKRLVKYFGMFTPDNMWDKMFSFGDVVSYLEKQKEQKPTNSEKPNEWSEEDEDMLNSCISSIEEAKENRYAYKETDGDTSYDREIAFLKSLHPQPKRKDTYYDIIHDILATLKDMDFMKITPEHRVSLLNDIRVKCKNADKCAAILDEPHWKPSKEQMDELREVIDLRRYLSPHLDSLYNDLKKL